MQKIPSVEQKIEYTIIPKLKEWDKVTLKSGDTLVMSWDFEKFDRDVLNELHKIISKIFPNNRILFIPKGTEIGVIKDESIKTF